jgi:large subunit ribosomal protein L21
MSEGLDRFARVAGRQQSTQRPRGTMYAVIETGGKQYRVEVGTELEVESLDAELGKTLKIERVLLVADGDAASIGRPVVEGAEVSAEVVRQTRGDKVISFKYRPKARRRVKHGHRQELTVLRVSDIVLNGKSAAKAAAKEQADARSERERLEEAAKAQAAKDAELAAKLAATKDADKAAPKTGRAKAKADAPTKTPSKAATTKPAAKTTTRGKASASAADKPAAKPAAAKPAAKASDKPATKPRATKPRATKKDE